MDGAQREVVRSRNRAAATRYRNKLVAQAESLEAEILELSCQRATLSASTSELRNELYQLKNEVFNHSNYPDPNIQSYLANATYQMCMSMAHHKEEANWSGEHNGGTASTFAEDKEYH